MFRYILSGLLFPALVFCQLDTAALADNQWVNFWPSTTPLSINGSNWVYENDFYSHPFYGLFVMGPGHVIHPQDCFFYPYDPIRNKWTKLNTAVRGPRNCLSSFCISSQDTAILWWGGAERSHQLSQGNFAADYRSINWDASRGTQMWVYSFNSNRWHEMQGAAALPPMSYTRLPVYDPVHDICINAKGDRTYIYNFHYNNTVYYSNPATFLEYLYSNAVDEKRGLYYMLCGGTSAMRSFDPENATWTTLSGTVPPCVPNDGASSPGVNAMAYDGLHDIMLYINGYNTTTTWAFDCAAKQWSQLSPQTPPTALGRLAYNRKLNVFLLLGGTATGSSCSRGGGIAGIWAYRYSSGASVQDNMVAAPKAGMNTTGGTVKIHWDRVSENGVTGYNIYRGSANPYPKGFARLNASAVTDTFYTDATAAAATWYSYRVCAIKSGVEGHLSRHLYTRPGRPLGVKASVEQAASVTVSWLPNPEPDIIGYNIYRAAGASIFGPLSGYTKLTSSPVNAVSYVDNVDLSDGAARGYIVTAVNALNIESGPSGRATTFPDSPEWCWTIGQSTPTGLQMAFRWQPPERTRILGVNLYRCTSTMLKQNTAGLITDTGATLWPMPPSTGGTGYEQIAQTYVVRAVNTLNQEGFLTDQISPINTEYGFGIVPQSLRYDNSLYAAVEGDNGPAGRVLSASRGLAVWPNPFNPAINVSFKSAAGRAARLSIYDTNGRLVRAKELRGDTERIVLADLAQGVYLVRVQCGNERLETRAVYLK